MVALEKLKEACLSTCGTLAAKKLHTPQNITHILQIHKQILYPESSSFTHSRRLSRLEMSKCKGGKSLVFISEF